MVMFKSPPSRSRENLKIAKSATGKPSVISTGLKSKQCPRSAEKLLDTIINDLYWEFILNWTVLTA